MADEMGRIEGKLDRVLIEQGKAAVAMARLEEQQKHVLQRLQNHDAQLGGHRNAIGEIQKTCAVRAPGCQRVDGEAEPKKSKAQVAKEGGIVAGLAAAVVAVWEIIKMVAVRP